MHILVVGQAHPCQITLDGEALCVSIAEKSNRWLPLGRLRFVLSYPLACWHSDAIVACGSHTISLTFVNGAQRAWLSAPLPAGKNDGLLARQLAAWMATETGQRRLKRWFAARKKQLRVLHGHPCAMPSTHTQHAVAAAVLYLLQRRYGIDPTDMEATLLPFHFFDELLSLIQAQLPASSHKTPHRAARQARAVARAELNHLHRFLVENRHELENALPYLL